MRSVLIALLISSLVLVGCAAKYESKVSFDLSDPLRVAVLPFMQVDDKGQVVIPNESDLLIDELSLLSTKLKMTPAKYVQSLVEKELSETNLNLVSPSFVASQLVHSGMGSHDLNGYKLMEVSQLSPLNLCERLSCDALLYGKLLTWDRTYYGVQSQSDLALQLKLVSAKDGATLFEATSKDSDGRGIFKIPTGISDLVLEPIKGLSNDIILSLAVKVVEKSLAPLKVSERPEFLKSPPPSIYASAHDSTSGTLYHDQYLTVLAFGTPKTQAFFSIGREIANIPMSEKSPGHFIGEYFPLPTDHFNDLPITVSLSDKYGKTSRQEIGTAKLTLK